VIGVAVVALAHVASQLRLVVLPVLLAVILSRSWRHRRAG